MISKNRLDKWTCSVQFIYNAKHSLLVPTGELVTPFQEIREKYATD